ncbi:uncharacterized protein LOC132902803 [Amyelois transitella]|uniref:uncharacterized protein LOC132902803 n=1 Tax=Amyelois transitella TaxID=680683 RepID=UPI00298F683A|nr:uncharacterized protein LOC132902803 [Amyelois transitella]
MVDNIKTYQCWYTKGTSIAHKQNRLSRNKLTDFLTKRSKSENVMDVADFSIYYDVNTNETIRNMMPRPWYKPGWLLRLPFTGGRCICEGLKCSCCTGIRIESFNFDRRTCAIFTYEPTDSVLDLEVKMNNDSVYRNSFSARNPPPFCVPIPVPYLPPGLVDMCVRLYDINIVQQMLHMCMDMDTRVDKAPVLVLHFDCMDMGFNGVSLSKPSNQTNVLTEDGTTTPTQPGVDVYDPVTETIQQTTSMFNMSIKYI